MNRVVVIGGGVIGSSIAYHLAAHPSFDGSITVIERDPTYARASSSLSASAIRQQFSTPVNIELSLYGIEFLRGAEETLAVADDRPALALREPGYLFLASDAGLAILRANHALQREFGADVALLDSAALAQRFPWLATGDIAAGSLGLSGEGWFDGPALHQAFRTRARSLGVNFVAGNAVGFTHDAKLRAVRLVDGSVCPADTAVIAAGGWSAKLAAELGLDLPIRPRRRMVFVVACRTPLPGCPLVIDPSGVWVRPEGDRFICGVSPSSGEDDPDEAPLIVDDSMFTERIWPILAARVPALAELKVTGSWAGYYDMNLFDHNAAVGALPGRPNVFIAAGFSGHGMQHAPGVGRAVSELIVDHRYVSIDLASLAPERIAAGNRLIEQNVV